MPGSKTSSHPIQSETIKRNKKVERQEKLLTRIRIKRKISEIKRFQLRIAKYVQARAGLIYDGALLVAKVILQPPLQFWAHLLILLFLRIDPPSANSFME